MGGRRLSTSMGVVKALLGRSAAQQRQMRSTHWMLWAKVCYIRVGLVQQGSST